jgi:hypothetical protein
MQNRFFEAITKVDKERKGRHERNKEKNSPKYEYAD